MATLEKIRKRSVLLIVIIGAALLAFILGDALTNGRTLFGDGTTVAKLGDAKVDISEYQQRVEQLQAANPDADAQEISQAVINMLIDEKLVDQAADAMGIEVSDDLLTFFILDNPLQPMQLFAQSNAEYIASIYPNLTAENYNPRLIHDLIFNPTKHGLKPEQVEALKQNWLVMEQETKTAARRQIYMQMLNSLIQPNALDKKDLFANQYESSTVDFAAKRFENLDKIKVSDAELKAEYEKRKNNYKVNEDTKTVGFLSFRVMPSAEDVKNANKLRDGALKALKSGSPLGKDLVKAGVRSERSIIAASAASDPRISQFLATAPADTVGVFDRGGSFELVKVISTGTMANEAADVVALQVAKDSEEAVKAALAGGLSIDSLATKFSADKVMTQPSQKIALQNPDQRRGLPASLAAGLDTVAAGAMLPIDANDQYAAYAYVKSVDPKVPVYEIESVTYEIYPSKETLEKASDAMAKYAAANNTPAKFAANAQKAGYTYQSMPVTGSTVAFRTQPQDMQLGNYYPMSSKLVSWAVTDGEPGNVSEVVNNENSQTPYIYIAMVENEYEDFAPYNDSNVKKDLEERIRRSKAGDQMVKQYSGKGDINATAAAMGQTVVADETVRFNPGSRINDPKVLARIAGTQPSSKVIVMKGDEGVYAVVVKAKNPATEKMNNDEVMGRYTNMFRTPDRTSRMLRGNSRLENHLYKMTGTR